MRDEHNIIMNLIPKLNGNPFGLLGFLEEEGTFGFKNLSPYFRDNTLEVP